MILFLIDIMHEKAKEFLDKTGATHAGRTEVTEGHGHAHEAMHNMDRVHFEGKTKERHLQI